MTDSTQPPLRIPVPADAEAEGKKARPALLQSVDRGGKSIADPFLDQVIIESVTYELAAVGRGEAGQARALDAKDKVLALEAVDGSTVFTHADRLREDIARLYPEALRQHSFDARSLFSYQGCSQFARKGHAAIGAFRAPLSETTICSARRTPQAPATTLQVTRPA